MLHHFEMEEVDTLPPAAMMTEPAVHTRGEWIEAEAGAWIGVDAETTIEGGMIVAEVHARVTDVGSTTKTASLKCWSDV